MTDNRELGELSVRVRTLTEAFGASREDERCRHEEMKRVLLKAIEVQEKVIADHAKRISALELARAMLIAVMATLAAIWSVVRVAIPYLGGRNNSGTP